MNSAFQIIRPLLFSLAAGLALAGCGGGGSGEAGTSVFSAAPAASAASSASSSASAVASSVELIATALQVPSGGDQVTVTATVKGSGNVGLPAAPVTFSATSGTLTAAATVTDSSGAATAVLSAGADRSNRSIVVSATSGSVTGSITLPVTGTTLSYSGVTTVALGGAAQLSVTAKDSKGTAIAGLSIGVTSSLGNTLSAATLVTDAQGGATVGYTAANAGTDQLRFNGGGATATTTIGISAENFAFVSPAANTSVQVGTRQPVTVQYLSSGVAQVGKSIGFAATAGTVTAADSAGACGGTTATTTAVTNAAGRATVCVASLTASPATIQATLMGVPNVSAQATVPLIFVASTPSKVVLQVTPTALSPNTSGSVLQKATVLATVTDATGNPVSGVTVDFNRVTDPSGGNLSQASALTSNSGQASVQYIAGAIATANNGVQLQATVEGFPSVTAGTASLTVSQSALFIALGTGNTAIALDPQTYQKDWVVYVTDSNGVPVSNVSLTIKALPVVYGKGQLYFVGGAWGWSETPQSSSQIDGASGEPLGVTGEGNYVCANEDRNYNGVLDAGEDTNGDGVLQPGNVIAVTTSSTSGASSGTVTTGASGRATISLVYARSYANWVKVRLVATAIVSGTESSTQAVFWAPGIASDYTTATVSPPGQVSPFGENACAVAH